MALNFPSNPTVGQVFQDYVWNGTAWAGIGSANNLGVQVGQLRTASPITVASQAARDTLIPTPVQGQTVFRSDLGFQQTYYGAWNATTNPGGRGTVGAWYDNQRNMGLVPIVPPTVAVSGGTATANSLGTVTFNSVTSIRLDGVFTSAYRNYRIVINWGKTTASDNFFCQFTANGASMGASARYLAVNNNGTVGSSSSAGVNFYHIGLITSNVPASFINFASIEVANPASSTDWTQITSNAWSSNNVSWESRFLGGGSDTTTAYDGIRFYAATNTPVFSGVVTVYGYNS